MSPGVNTQNPFLEPFAPVLWIVSAIAMFRQLEFFRLPIESNRSEQRYDYLLSRRPFDSKMTTDGRHAAALVNQISITTERT
jgi:hypothetical protein